MQYRDSVASTQLCCCGHVCDLSVEKLGFDVGVGCRLPLPCHEPQHFGQRRVVLLQLLGRCQRREECKRLL